MIFFFDIQGFSHQYFFYKKMGNVTSKSIHKVKILDSSYSSNNFPYLLAHKLRNRKWEMHQRTGHLKHLGDGEIIFLDKTTLNFNIYKAKNKYLIVRKVDSEYKRSYISIKPINQLK